MAQMLTLATHLFTHSQPLLLSDHTDAFPWLPLTTRSRRGR